MHTLISLKAKSSQSTVNAKWREYKHGARTVGYCPNNTTNTSQVPRVPSRRKNTPLLREKQAGQWSLKTGYSYLKGVFFWCSEKGGKLHQSPFFRSLAALHETAQTLLFAGMMGYASCEFLCQRTKSIGNACAVISSFVVSCTRRLKCVYNLLHPFALHAMRGPVETAAKSISLGALLPTAEVPPLQCNFLQLTRIRRSAQYKGFPHTLFSLCNGNIIFTFVACNLAPPLDENVLQKVSGGQRFSTIIACQPGLFSEYCKSGQVFNSSVFVWETYHRAKRVYWRICKIAVLMRLLCYNMNCVCVYLMITIRLSGAATCTQNMHSVQRTQAVTQGRLAVLF